MLYAVCSDFIADVFTWMLSAKFIGWPYEYNTIFLLGDGSFDVTARISDGGWWPDNKLHAASTSETETLMAVIGSLVCLLWFNLIAITSVPHFCVI